MKVSMTTIKIKKINPEAIIPQKNSLSAVGYDLYANNFEEVKINPQETKLIGTGIALEIPEGHVGLIYARSGLATKEGLAPANKVGVIDPDYRGEVLVSLFNQSNITRIITPRQRIAQLVFMEVPKTSLEEVNELSESQREAGGFGSTGK